MGLIDVTKTYTIHYGTMTDAQWNALAAVYATLPDFLGYSAHDSCPAWFGWPPDDGGRAGGAYLSASVEPGGLLVCGALSPDVWAAWDSTFMAAASRALGFPVRDADE